MYLCTRNIYFPLKLIARLLKQFKKLGLKYVDLYLIHWLVRMKQGVEGFNFIREDVTLFDINGTWEAMEKCCKLGLAQSIGVSNIGMIKL